MFSYGGQRHHFVSKNALSAYNYDTDAAYAIRMVAYDHTKTGSYGGNASFREQEKKYLAAKQYDNLLNFEVADLSSQIDEYGVNLAVKYNPQITTCVQQYKIMFGIS